MRSLTIGKLRGLQQCSDERGTLAVLALDHRNNLRQALRPRAPEEVTAGDLVAFKQEVVAGVAEAATAVLLDPEFGGAQAIATRALPGDKGLVVALEATGYEGEAKARRSGILPGWSVAKAKRMGASAVKLLVYYHPGAHTASEIEGLVHQVAEDCTREDLALLLEPLSYSLDPEAGRLPPDERRRVIVETARRLVAPGVDVLKAEFPGASTGETEWADACRELSEASDAPWILLSASVDYETFLAQSEAACRAGASGVAVGRAVWREATGLVAQDRTDFLRGEARRRMARIAALCFSLARPWTAFYATPQPDGQWFARY